MDFLALLPLEEPHHCKDSTPLERGATVVSREAAPLWGKVNIKSRLARSRIGVAGQHDSGRIFISPTFYDFVEFVTTKTTF